MQQQIIKIEFIGLEIQRPDGNIPQHDAARPRQRAVIGGQVKATEAECFIVTQPASIHATVTADALRRKVSTL